MYLLPYCNIIHSIYYIYHDYRLGCQDGNDRQKWQRPGLGKGNRLRRPLHPLPPPPHKKERKENKDFILGTLFFPSQT